MLYGITVAIAWFMLPATDRMSRCSQVVDSVGVIGRRILSQIFFADDGLLLVSSAFSLHWNSL